jgi:hypothetical protein
VALPSLDEAFFATHYPFPAATISNKLFSDFGIVAHPIGLPAVRHRWTRPVPPGNHP